MPNTFTPTPQQAEAIAEIDKNLQIIACAGSGKTEVITRRIANILLRKTEITTKNIVAFTFTEKASASMKYRIAKALEGNNQHNIDNMYVGTIHGFCYHLLNKFTDKFRDYKILDTVKNHLFVTRYANECGMSDLGLDVYPRNVNLFLSCIDKMIDDFENADTWTQEHRDVLDKYISCIYNHGYIDFSLLIFETLRQIEENPDVLKALSDIKYLIVDEYQDIDNLQEKLIAHIYKAGANVCVVGDDDQTIYQFRGSNAENMISFSERYANVHQVRLEDNFRCSSEIVDIARSVIDHNERRIPKRMVSEVSFKTSEINASRFETQNEQFESIAQKVIDLHENGLPYSEISILVRKGKTINSIARILTDFGIPFEANSADCFFSGDYCSRFKTTLQLLSDIDKAKLYECWQDVAEPSGFNIAFKFLRSCSRGGNLHLSEIIQGFCEKISFLDEGAEDIDDRNIALQGICKILDDYDEIYGDWQLSGRIAGVLRFLGFQAEDEYKYHNFKDDNSRLDAVQIMTVHKAKGLEFDTVFIPELTKRYFPVSNMGGKRYYHVLGGVFEQNKDKYQSDIEDERKLFYVAVTRAKRNLYMSYVLDVQPVSCFVAEAAQSPYLNINRSDLVYNPKVEIESYTSNTKNHIPNYDCQEKQYEDKQKEWEEERLKRQEYWAIVKYARKALYDYYGTACHFFPGAHGDLVRIKNMDPDEILWEASKNGLI